MTRAAWRVVAVTVPLMALVAATGCARRTPRAHAVTIRNFHYEPATLEVAQGDTVVFTNTDIVPHTATARDGRWDSKEIAASAGTWRLVARTPGRHAFYCTFHPTMQGTLTVH